MPVAPQNGNNGGFFGGDGIWAIIIFAIIFGWGGFGGFGGYGGGNSGAVDNYVLASDFSQLDRKIESVNNGICSLGYDQLAQMDRINQNVSDVGFGLQSAITTNGYETRNAITQQTIAEMQNNNALTKQISDCCCENREAIANLNYNLATQTCETKQAIADGTKAIIDFLTQDKISTLTAENQSLKFAASQNAQTAYLANVFNSGCGCNTRCC